MTPSEWRTARVYDPTGDNPAPRLAVPRSLEPNLWAIGAVCAAVILAAGLFVAVMA